MLVAKSEANYYPEYIYEEEYRQVVEKKRRRRVKKASKRKNNSKVLVKFACFTMALISLSIALFILVGYSQITSLRMEVTKLERQKLELEKSKMNLVADLEELKNTINVSEEAITKLGMSYPKEGQIIYVSTEDTRVETSIDESASSKLNEFLSIFSGFFRRLQI